MRIVLIITAAGLSKRHPPNKLLNKLSSETVIEKTINLFIPFFPEIIVVLGHQAEIMRVLLKRYGSQIQIVFNPDYKIGLASSIRSALNAIDIKPDYLCFCPADKPFIKKETIKYLLDILVEKGPSILVPHFNNKNGHPTLFHRSFWNEFLNISGDTGGRDIITNHKKSVNFVEVADAGVINDMDLYLKK